MFFRTMSLYDAHKKRTSILLLLFILFWLLSVLHLHGYSLSHWRAYIDQSFPNEILLGEARGIRSDDWLVGIPFSLSQVVHKPSFPVLNNLIGYEQNMLMTQTPVKHWVSIFRPHLWGYFIGADFGLAWNWWFYVLGLLASFFLVFCLISGNRIGLSFLASLTLLYSPFIQFWSLNCAPLCIFMALCFIFVIHLLFSESKMKMFIFSLLLGWSGVSFILQFYPPYQVSLSYLFIFMVVGFIWKQWRGGVIVKNIPYKLFCLTIAAGLIIVFVSLFYQETKDVFQTMMNTAYPGQRFETGGGYPLWMLFSNGFIPWTKIKEWGDFGNICEASSFLFLFPITGIFILRNLLRYRRNIDPFSCLIFLYILILLYWWLYGFSPIFSKLTLFSMMPVHRSKLGIGVADLVLLVSVLSHSNETVSKSKEKYVLSLIIGIYFILMVIMGMRVKDVLGSISDLNIYFSALIVAVISGLVFVKSRWALPLVAVISIFLSGWFNPLVRGGTDYLIKNDLSKKIIELDRQAGGGTTWVTYGSLVLPDLFRIIGIKCLNGVHYYPQFDLWSKLDYEVKYKSTYNRYAHIIFAVPEDKDTITFANPQHDVLTVTIHPDNLLFSKLKVDYILFVASDPAILNSAKSLEHIYSIGEMHIYRVKK